MFPEARDKWCAGLSILAACLTNAFLGSLVQRGPLPMLGWATAFVCGSLLGLLVFPLSRLTAALPKRVAAIAFVTAGLLLGGVVALKTGAWNKLNGPHRNMACAMLIGAPALGVALATAVLWVVARGRWPRQWLAVTSSMLCLVGALGGLAIQEAVFVLRGYPVLGLALETGIVVLLSLSLHILLASLSSRIRRALLWSLAAASPFALVVCLRAGSREFSELMRVRAMAHQVQFLRWVTDVDRDGYSPLFGGGDCAAFDSSVHPGALEIPGNGKDDNCQYGDGMPRRTATLPPPPPPSLVERNVLLVTVDALRPDHMSVYGYERPTTPFLSSFASDATVFTHALTNGAWTSLALPALFTSTLPRDSVWRLHAVTETGRVIPWPIPSDGLRGEKVIVLWPAPESLPWPSLPWWLARRGMTTMGVVANEMLERVEPIFKDQFHRLVPGGPDDESVARTAAALVEEVANTPWFLWVHYFGTHEPYPARSDVPRFGDTFVDRYDRSVRSVDAEIQRLVEAVERKAPRRTDIIVTADHGEELGATGGFHGLDLRESALRIPMIVKGEGFRPRRVDTMVSLVDVMPTILRWTGTEGPPLAVGVPLTDDHPGSVVFTDLWRYDFSGNLAFNATAVFSPSELFERDILHTADRLSPRPVVTATPGVDGSPSRPALQRLLAEYLERAVGGP